MRPNSASIDRAILATLQGDATLAQLLPHGIYFNLAQPGAKVFGLVGIFDWLDVGIFGHRGWEDALYFVKAVGFSTVTTLDEMTDAAYRIDELLDHSMLTVADYGSFDCVREERLADTVPDPVDPTLKVFHFGGHYRVIAQWPE